MSHTVKIKVQYKVSEAGQLEKAFKTLGWGFVENASAREYSGRSSTYPYVAVNPEKVGNAYDIGIKSEGGNLGLFTDMWGGSVERGLGKGFSKLNQEFAAAVIENGFTFPHSGPKCGGSDVNKLPD